MSGRGRRASRGPLVALLVVATIAALPYNPAVNADIVGLGPSIAHPLGTDAVGRDVGLRLLAAVRPLVIGGGTALAIALLLGVPLGALAGARGGIWSRWIRGFGLAVSSLPAIPLVLLLGLVVGHGAVPLGLAWGVAMAPGVLQALYQRVDALRREERLLALVAHGIPEWRAVAVHLVWNNARTELRTWSARVLAGFLAMETALSYLGRAGVAEPQPSWGNMLAMALSAGSSQNAAAWIAPAVAVAVVSAGLWGLALGVPRLAPGEDIVAAPGALDVRALEIRSADRVVARLPELGAPPGTVTALLGVSGVGKSLVLRAIARILPDGLRATGRLTRPALAWIAQDGRSSLDPLLRIREQAPDPGAALARSGFPADRLDAWPHELSGGEAQRAALLCVLSGPSVGLLLADEPTTGLDPRARRALVRTLLTVARAPSGPAVVFVTHDRRLLPGFADAIVEMDGARPAPPALAPRVRPSPGPVLLHAEGLSVVAGLTRRPAYPAAPPILTGLSVDVRGGETVGLIGESGVGKTTLLRAFAGLCASSGTLDVLGVDPRSARPKGVQLLWQDPGTSLDPALTVREILSISAAIGQGHRTVDEALRRVGLLTQADAVPDELSGGERRRVSLAQVWLAGAVLVLADEPSAALDAQRSLEALDLLRDLVGETGGVVIASHDLVLVLPTCDRVYVLHEGRCVDVFSPSEADDPGRHPYTRDLLAAG